MTSHGAPKSSRSQEPSEGVRIQPRDRSIVWMSAANGWVTMPQLKLFAFDYLDETGWLRTVSEQAVYRRLRKLCGAGFLEHRYTWVGDHGVYRATKRGLALVGLDLAPASLDKRDYEHDLQVVDLALELTDYRLDGWITERMIRSRLKPGMSIGRVPDGLYIGEGGERWAIELEVSGKESQRYHEACTKYAGRHREGLPEESSEWGMEEHIDDYIESGGTIDGVVWYFYSERKKQRARTEAGRVIEARKRQRQPTDHIRLVFDIAYQPSLPPLEKYEQQQERKREAEEQQRRQREQRERRERQRRQEREEQAKQDLLYREAVAYLTEEEERRVYESISAETGSLDPGDRIPDSVIRKAVIEAAADKHQAEQEKNRVREEKEERRRQRRESAKSWIKGQ